MGKIIIYYYIRRYKWLIMTGIYKITNLINNKIYTIKNTPSIGYGFKWNTIKGVE